MPSPSANRAARSADWGSAENLALLGVGTWEYAPATRSLVLAPLLRRMLAWPLDPKGDFAIAFHPSDRSEVRALLRAAEEVPGEYRREFRAIGSNGTVRIVAVACRTIEDPEGTRIAGAVQDITEWREQEGALREREQRWNAALKGSNFGVWDWDLKSNRVVVSGHLAELLGYSTEGSNEVSNLWTQVLHPDDRRATHSALQAHLDGKTPQYRMEHRLRHEDGTYRWMLSRGAAIRNEEGLAYRVVGICTDITRRVETLRALEQSEARLRAIVDGSFDGLLLLEAVRAEDGAISDFEFVHVNGRALDILGMTSDQLLGRRLTELMPDAVPSGLFDRYVRVLQTQEKDLNEFDGICPNGRGRLYRQQIVPVGQGVAVALNDITEERSREAALRDTEKLVSEIATAVPEFLYVVDLVERKVTYRNRSLRAALGYRDRTEVDHDEPLLMEMLEEPDRVRLAELEARIVSGEEDHPVEVEVRAKRADGAFEWLSLRHSVFARDDFGRAIQMLGSASLISMRKKAEERMREHVLALNRTQAELQMRQSELEKLNARLLTLARKDGLTDVYNHRAFQERLAEEVARARRNGAPLCLLLGDVDDFKAYNDKYGHVAGDERLQYFGAVLQRCTRPSDFVARYGGEEFAVILPETAAAQGVVVGERILQALAEESGSRRITASFGLAEFGDDIPTPTALIASADAALYTAKHTGKNRVATAQPGARLG